MWSGKTVWIYFYESKETNVPEVKGSGTFVCLGSTNKKRREASFSFVDCVGFSWNALVSELKLWSEFQAEMKAYATA